MKSLFLSIGLILFTISAHAENGLSPYFSKVETWALSTELENRLYPRSTFIPRRFLLYISDRETTKTIPKNGGEEYLKATTQDGVEVYVFEKAVSKNTFKKSVGSHQVIFNTKYDICYEPGCDKNDDRLTWMVNAGDAFVKEEVENFYKLTSGGSGDEEKNIGYLSKGDFKRLNRTGVITRADKKHPKYEITKTLSKKLSTECGEQNKEENIITIPDSDKPLVNLFSLGGNLNSDGDLVLKKNYGSQNSKVSFYLFKIISQREEENFCKSEDECQIGAEIVYHCTPHGAGSGETIDYIEQVHLVGEVGGDYKDILIRINNYDIPTNLRSKTSAPYLFSINNYTQYKNAIKILGNDIGDRSLAGYFLSLLNRSCNYEYRKSECCQNYEIK